jgi:hypothetical protein
MNKFAWIGSVAALALAASVSASAAHEMAKRSTSKMQAGTSAIYRQVDASFSPLVMDTPLAQLRRQVTNPRAITCDEEGGCNWTNAAGVRHYFYGETPASRVLVNKYVGASNFARRPIAALGIGSARDQRTVLANIRRAFPRLNIRCDPERVSGNVGPVECSADVAPGWVQIGFTRAGVLQAVQFQAYQYI